MSTIAAFLAVGAAALLSLVLSRIQAGINARHGTDHAVHIFLINRIRENRFRLFVRIPRLLNETYIGALPLYLHWIFAHFPLKIMRAAEKLLNPVMNGVHTLLVGALGLQIGREIGEGPVVSAFAAVLFALTPQFYHALSARNFGLSARSIGLVLLTLAFFSAWRVEGETGNFLAWAALAISCYLVIAFSTFGAQVLVIVSTLLALLTGHVFPLAGVAAGLLIFLVVHPRYAAGYFLHTARFISAYARELAPVYVLARRESIWRDLVWDIWRKLRENPKAAFRYAYENSVLIVLFLNPLVVVAAILALPGAPGLDAVEGGLFDFALDVALCGLLAMLLTSFRWTRFLGEPERYAEAVTPFAILATAAFILARLGPISAAGVVAVFAALTALQIAASHVLARYLSSKPNRLNEARDAIEKDMAPHVRLAGNNEQFLKLLLTNDWQFLFCMSISRRYCGMAISEVFAPYPFLHREALAKIVKDYQITVCLLDRTRYETLFDTPPEGLNDTRVIFESVGVRVLAFKWVGPPPSSTAD